MCIKEHQVIVSLKTVKFQMILSLTSFGMWKLTLQDNIQEGYTALDARSRFENAVMRQFSGTSSKFLQQL